MKSGPTVCCATVQVRCERKLAGLYQSQRTRKPCGHTFFVQPCLPVNPLPTNRQASAEGLRCWGERRGAAEQAGERAEQPWGQEEGKVGDRVRKQAERQAQGVTCIVHKHVQRRGTVAIDATRETEPGWKNKLWNGELFKRTQKGKKTNVMEKGRIKALKMWTWLGTKEKGKPKQYFKSLSGNITLWWWPLHVPLPFSAQLVSKCSTALHRKVSRKLIQILTIRRENCRNFTLHVCTRGGRVTMCSAGIAGAITIPRLPADSLRKPNLFVLKFGKESLCWSSNFCILCITIIQ